MKRFAIHILIVLILCGVFCDVYFTISQLSCGRVWLSDSEVYAADGWEAVTQEDLVTAFQYYCKSRNLTIDGSIADALTSFTTTTFNNICNTLGIDVNSLQANLKKTVEGNLGLRFLMNQQGVLAYNRIFAEFLQNNDLSVGDEVENKSLFNGEYYNNSLIWVVSSLNVTHTSEAQSKIITRGSVYKGFSSLYLYNLFNSGTTNISVDGFNFRLLLEGNNYADANNKKYSLYALKYSSNSSVSFIGVYNDDSGYFLLGDLALVYNQANNRYYYCVASKYTNDGLYSIYSLNAYKSSVTDAEDANIYITTNNKTINNNNYNNNYTIIYNDGDTYISDDDDEPDPTTPPEGGGGGGDDPDQPSPSGPDLPDWRSLHGTGTIGSDGTFDFDIPFSLPDLNIDWSLKNIGQKFPFCIPSDIVSFYQVLAVEPEAPAIDAHIPLGSFYDWHFEADFAQYDNWARIIRIVEYVGFVITLIYFTVKLVKG